MAKGFKHKVARKQPLQINTTDLCAYGCGQQALWQFNSGKICCAKSFNSCPEKRRRFSANVDHASYAAKSLATRTKMGITKSSQVKATRTRKANGHYLRLAKTMKQHWIEHPWSNDHRCQLTPFKNTGLLYQGSYELAFLERLENEHGLDWVLKHVRRGPPIWYNDSGVDRLYLPDFIINNTIYEIKSGYTWNRLGRDAELEKKNRSKLKSSADLGYNVILVLDHKEVKI